LKEEHTSRYSIQSSAIVATSAFGDALLKSFQNIEKRRQVFGEVSIIIRFRKNPSTRILFFLLVKRHALFTRIQGAM
jgi:hypothetical protein